MFNLIVLVTHVVMYHDGDCLPVSPMLIMRLSSSEVGDNSSLIAQAE